MALNKEKITTRVASLLEKFEITFFDLGAILHQAQQEDPELFKALQELPGLKERRAYYFAEIYRIFSTYPVSKERLASVGWTKLLRISKHVTVDNYQSLINLARDHTDKQLELYFARQRAAAIIQANMRTVSLSLTDEEYAAYAKVLVAYGAVRRGKGLQHQKDAFMKMIRDLAAKSN
jgi:hypothetical protein